MEVGVGETKFFVNKDMCRDPKKRKDKINFEVKPFGGGSNHQVV